MLYIKTDGRAVGKTIVLPNNTRCHQVKSILTSDDLIQILTNSKMIVLEDVDHNVSSIYHKDKIRHDGTSLGNHMTVQSNVKLIDFDKDKNLDTPERVAQFVSATLKFNHFIITPSTSNIDKRKAYKWHVYVIFDKPVNLKKFGLYINNHLPVESFKEELKTNIHGNQYLHRYNGIVDTTIYTSNGRKIAEHPSIKRFHTYGNTAERSSAINSLWLERDIKPVKLYTPEEVVNINTSSTFNTSDLLQRYPSGEYVSVKDVIDNDKPMRFVSPVDMGTKIENSMGYNPVTRTFKDYNQGGKIFTVTSLKEETIEYGSKYAPSFNLTHDNTFILSPTGSGKTTQIVDSMRSNTIFIAPKKAIVHAYIDNPDVNVMTSGLTRWENLRTDKINMMTFDKLAGHISRGKDISEYNIVIDEIHTLWNNHEKSVAHTLYSEILMRGTGYKKLVLLSATQKPDAIQIEDLKTYRYINTSKTTKINFVINVPNVYSMINGRTLIFIQSRARAAAMFDTLSAKGVSTINLKAGDMIPKCMDEYDVIITTSVLREGFSITSRVDTLILYNNIGTQFGAADIVQSVSRPRTSSPDIYIVSAKSHFSGSDNIQIPLAKLNELAYDLSKGYDIQDLKILKALNLNMFKVRALMYTNDHKVVVNSIGVLNYYHSQLALMERLDKNVMIASLNYYMDCDVNFIKMTDDDSDLPSINAKDIKKKCKAAKTYEEMHRIIEYIRDLSKVSTELTEFLNTIKEPITSINTREGVFYLDEEHQVQYSVNPLQSSGIDQHVNNINSGVYEKLEGKRSWGPKLYDNKGIARIINSIDPQTDDIDVINTLNRICVYHKSDTTGRVIRRGKYTHIMIRNTRLYNFSRIRPDQQDIFMST